MKKLLMLTMILTLSLVGLAGCGKEEEPTAQGDGVLKIFGWPTFASEDEQAMFEETVSEVVGMPVEITVPTDDYEKQLSMALSSGEVYDIIYLQQAAYMDLVSQGALMDLTPYIEESEVLSDPEIIDPEMYYEPLDVEGSVYALPTKYEGGLMPIVNQAWLDEFGMEVPTTLEEWEAYWAACKEEKGVYGITLRGIDYIEGFMSAWGLQEGVVINEDGTATIPYASDEAAAAWDWWQEMYLAGYVEPNFETNSSDDFRNQFMAGQTGSVCYWFHWVGTFDKKVADNPDLDPTQFDAVAAPPVEGPNGEMYLSLGDLSLVAIPANADNPDQAIEFMEWYYGDEGSFFSKFGFEGNDYTVDENGVITLTEVGAEHNLNHTSNYPVNENWQYPNDMTYEEADPAMEAIMADEEAANEMCKEYGVAVYKPSNWDEMNAVITKYASQCIKGQISGEEAVASMQEELVALGEQAEPALTIEF